LLLDLAYTVGGLAVLIFAADRLVTSAVRISRFLGVSAVLIGAVIVGFGTSAPEFLVSGLAAAEGHLDLAMSNVISSNISNVTLVLGSAAILVTLASRRAIVRREGALMFASVVALALALADGSVQIWEGALLLVGMVVAIYLLVRWARSDGPAVVLPIDDDDDDDDDEDDEEEPTDANGRDRAALGREIVIGLVALVLTLLAADFLLDGAIGLGERFGLSPAFLGLLTGVGTSLPELSAALAGARRRQTDLVLGNVMGSNIFNSLGVAGVAAVLGPGELSHITPALLIVMVIACSLAGAFANTGQRIIRAEGIALLVGFVVYVVMVY
jgi:cation:H+ antiporter